VLDRGARRRGLVSRVLEVLALLGGYSQIIGERIAGSADSRFQRGPGIQFPTDARRSQFFHHRCQIFQPVESE
jgi:hypothetical protein